jgi:hypothetical protein
MVVYSAIMDDKKKQWKELNKNCHCLAPDLQDQERRPSPEVIRDSWLRQVGRLVVERIDLKRVGASVALLAALSLAACEEPVQDAILGPKPATIAEIYGGTTGDVQLNNVAVQLVDHKPNQVCGQDNQSAVIYDTDKYGQPIGRGYAATYDPCTPDPTQLSLRIPPSGITGLARGEEATFANIEGTITKSGLRIWHVDKEAPPPTISFGPASPLPGKPAPPTQSPAHAQQVPYSLTPSQIKTGINLPQVDANQSEVFRDYPGKTVRLIPIRNGAFLILYPASGVGPRQVLILDSDHVPGVVWGNNTFGSPSVAAQTPTDLPNDLPPHKGYYCLSVGVEAVNKTIEVKDTSTCKPIPDAANKTLQAAG